VGLQPIIVSSEPGEKLILTVIYLGSTLPKYVLKNLEYLHSTFDDNEIYFISDSVSSIKKAAKLGVKTWLAPNPDNQWREVREQLNHPMGFRNGFWFKTLARIFVLNSFLQLNKFERCLQIEADVFLFPNFPLTRFLELDAEIAFPMESNQMGIASLLYLQDHRSAESLAGFALNAIQLNPQITDMSLLGLIARSEALKFLPLRTLPIHMQSALTQPEALNLVCDNRLGAPGVFDGITVGQYLLGIDPRNSRGTRILHRRQHSHAIDPEKLIFDFDNEKNLVLNGANEKSIIYNLHNHAKDLRLYKESSRMKLLEKRVKSSILGEKKEFLLGSFLSSASAAIARRVKNGFHPKAN